MTDVLIRDVPEDDLRGIDEAADRLGLSRTAFLRREMRRIARQSVSDEIGPEDYQRSLAAMADLGDEEIMRQAWS